MNPPLKSIANRNHAEPDTQELSALKAQIADGVSRWLRSTANHSASQPNAHLGLLGEANGSSDNDKVRQKLLDQVNTICEQAWSVHIGESPTLPNTPDSEGSLPKEIQKWAIAQAVFRLTRSLDIRAAMEVCGPFEKVAQDRDYLMAVGQKNSSEDSFGRKVDVAEYEIHSGPEIAYKLILRAQRDMFEADLCAWPASPAIRTSSTDSQVAARRCSRTLSNTGAATRAACATNERRSPPSEPNHAEALFCA
jgi:hypothetical protein